MKAGKIAIITAALRCPYCEYGDAALFDNGVGWMHPDRQDPNERIDFTTAKGTHCVRCPYCNNLVKIPSFFTSATDV